MKYETQIYSEENGYTGVVVLDKEVIYKSALVSSISAVNKSIDNFIKNNPLPSATTAASQPKRNSSIQRPSKQPSIISVPRSSLPSAPINNTFQNSFTPPPQRSTRRCCGRG